MTSFPHLVGMVHLQPLPGAPGFVGSVDGVIEAAVADAHLLKEAGFPALMVENFGDVPFYADEVPPVTVAGLTRVVDAVIREVQLPVGVNVLRNDAMAALSIATIVDAPVIRVNVLTGMMYTDQGPIVGNAANLLRRRAELGANVEVWADVLVKHATPPHGMDITQATLDTLERGQADALIISGSGTGESPDLDRLKQARQAVGKGVRLVIGSGANPDNLESLSEFADTFIVGSYVKHDGSATKPVDPQRAREIVNKATDLGVI